MSKYAEVVYMVNDLVKLTSNDSVFTEDHIIYLLDTTRATLLEQRTKLAALTLSSDNYQTIRIPLKKDVSEPYSCYSGCYQYKSKCPIPSIMFPSGVKIGYSGIVKKFGRVSFRVQYVTPERFTFCGESKYTKNFIWCTIMNDGYMYVRTPINLDGDIAEPEEGETIHTHEKLSNECFELTAVFTEPSKASTYECDCNENTCPADGSLYSCNVLENDFPVEAAILNPIIEAVATKLATAEYKPSDPANNSTDDLASIQTFIRNAMKDRFIKDTQQ